MSPGSLPPQRASSFQNRSEFELTDRRDHGLSFWGVLDAFSSKILLTIKILGDEDDD
jgi:hypothetical protein